VEPLDETMIDRSHWSHWTRRSTGDRSHCLETRRSTGATGDDRQEPLETTIDSTGATGDDRQEPLLVVEPQLETTTIDRTSHWRQSTGATGGVRPHH